MCRESLIKKNEKVKLQHVFLCRVLVGIGLQGVVLCISMDDKSQNKLSTTKYRMTIVPLLQEQKMYSNAKYFKHSNIYSTF